jgi:hypothetical protein
MVVLDCNIYCAAFPAKYDSVLILDPDTIFISTRSSEFLEEISWREFKILKPGSVQHKIQLSCGECMKSPWKDLTAELCVVAVCDGTRASIAEPIHVPAL